MSEEAVGEVKIIIYPNNYRIVATTHKDGQSVEVGIEKAEFFPYLNVLHIENLEVKIVQSHRKGEENEK